MLSLASTADHLFPCLHPRDLPVYDHENLGPLRELDEKLRDLLETVIPSNYVSLPLKLIRPSIYASSIVRKPLPHNTRLYLAIQAEMDEGELIRRRRSSSRSAPPATSSTLCARRAGSATDPRDVAAHHHPHQAESPVFRPESRRVGMGSGRGGPGAQSAAYVPGDFPNPLNGIDHRAPAGGRTAAPGGAACFIGV